MGISLFSTEQCISKCLECQRICTEQAMNHCLDHGGRHVEPAHFRLMVNCADICGVAAKFMMSGSDLHGKVCAVCADVCEACARSCEEVGEMEECARVCHECADSCAQMAGAVPGRQRSAREARTTSPSV